MREREFDINVHINISIPIIGDETIMLIAPPENFAYKKITFDEYEYKERLIDGTGDVFYDFYYAIHKSNVEKFIVVLECDMCRIIKHDKPANALGFMWNDFEIICDSLKEEYAKQLFNYISMVHLFKEGEIAIKYSFFTFNAEEKSENITCKNRSISRTVSADMITLIRDPMIVNQNEASEMSIFITSHGKAYNILKTVVIDNLEYTYHILDEATSYINLITALEVMFLLKNQSGDKKEMLAKRIAVFIGENNVEIGEIYNNVKTYYTNRSKAVHEGITDPLTKMALNELRIVVRDTTQKYIGFIEQKVIESPEITFKDIKKKLVDDLMSIVTLKIEERFLPENRIETP